MSDPVKKCEDAEDIAFAIQEGYTCKGNPHVPPKCGYIAKKIDMTSLLDLFKRINHETIQCQICGEMINISDMPDGKHASLHHLYHEHGMWWQFHGKNEFNTHQYWQSEPWEGVKRIGETASLADAFPHTRFSKSKIGLSLPTRESIKPVRPLTVEETEMFQKQGLVEKHGALVDADLVEGLQERLERNKRLSGSPVVVNTDSEENPRCHGQILIKLWKERFA